MIRKLKYIAIIIFSLLLTRSYAQNYSVSNVSLLNTGASLAIKYDLNSKILSDIFEVSIKVYGKDGNEFTTTTLTGSIGKGQTAGLGKIIHWFARQDGFLIDEDIFVDIFVRKQNYNVPLTSHLIKSAVIPGWGDYNLTNGKFYFAKGLIGYGLIGGSLLLNQQAYNNRQNYLNSSQTAERNNLYDKYNQQQTSSYIIAGLAVAWWAYDMYRVIHKRNKLSKEITPQKSRFYYNKTQKYELTRSNIFKFDTYSPYDKDNKKGDELYALKDYTSAKAAYLKALELKPFEEYPKKKIHEIDAILDAIALKEANYKYNIQKADSLFAKSDFETAKSFYELALTFKPTDTYATNKADESEKEMIKIPILKIEQTSFLFLDGNKENNALDALEDGNIVFNITNKGKLNAEEVIVKIKELNNIVGLNYEKIINIGNFEVNQTKRINIPISGNFELSNGKASFQIKVDERNGFGMKAFEIEIPTLEFVSPKLEIVDYSVSSPAGSIVKAEAFDMVIMLQNTGLGKAENVTVDLNLPVGVIIGKGNKTNSIELLASGESKKIKYKLFVTDNFEGKDIQFNISLNEKYKKFGNTKTVEIALNQQVDNTPKTVVEAKVITPSLFTIASLSSLVDKNIPVNPVKNNKKFALIIGNEDYQKYQQTLNSESNVEFARNDAKTFSEYAVKTLGIPDENLITIYDATSASMNQKIELICKRLKLSGNESELVFYYAGHGLPDEVTKVPYIIPVDVSGSNLSSAIKLEEVYRKFTETGIAKITVFLDACFSGGARNQSLLATRGIKVKPNESFLKGKLIVFAATSGEQSAHPFAQQQHGLFTYHLLKKLQESSGNITYKELADYLKFNVNNEALRIKEVEQEPHVIVSPDAENIWQNWKF